MESMTNRIESTQHQVTTMNNTLAFLALEYSDLFPAMDVSQLVRLAEWCAEMKKVLSLIEHDAIRTAARKIPSDTKVSEWADGSGQLFKSELHFKSIRTKVDREGLYSAVKKTARVTDLSTGEVSYDNEQLLATLERAFRFEPRWTSIKELGIDPDDYCQTRYEPQIETTPLASGAE